MASRIVTLDLLRGVAAWGVAVSHYFSLVHQSDSAELISSVFVEIFFPLSGFVLASQLLMCMESKNNLRVFFMRRWVRTIPPYLIAITATAIIADTLLTRDFLFYLFFLQDIYPGAVANAFYPVAWSLSIEESFYILFPLGLLLFGLSRRRLYLIIFIMAFHVARVSMLGGGDAQYIRIGTLLRLDAIAFGFVLFLYFKDALGSGLIDLDRR